MGHLKSMKNQIKLICIMYHGLFNIPLNEYTLQSTITHTRHSHQHKILPILANKNPFHHFFLPRTMPLWNSLPPNLIDQSSLDNFRNLLNDIDFNFF